MADNGTGNYSINGNWTYQPWPPYCPVDTSLTIGLKTAAYVLLMLISFVGNVLIIDIVRRNQIFRSTVDLLIANMCASDLLISFFMIPYRIKEIFIDAEWFDGVFGIILCKLVAFGMDVSFTVSILSMLAIAVERFRCVVYATKPSLVTVKTRRRLIALIWVLAAMTYSVYFYTFRIVPFDSGVHCYSVWYVDYERNLRAQQIHFTTLVVLQVVLPLIVISVLYTAIIVSLHRQKRRMAAHLASEALRRRAQLNKRITLMLLTVVVSFLLAYIPLGVYAFLSFYIQSITKKLCHFGFVSLVLFCIPSVINPVVYFVFSEKYRQGLRQLICFTATCQSCPGYNHHPDNCACAAAKVENNQAIQTKEVLQAQPL